NASSPTETVSSDLDKIFSSSVEPDLTSAITYITVHFPGIENIFSKEKFGAFYDISLYSFYLSHMEDPFKEWLFILIVSSFVLACAITITWNLLHIVKYDVQFWHFV